MDDNMSDVQLTTIDTDSGQDFTDSNPLVNFKIPTYVTGQQLSSRELIPQARQYQSMMLKFCFPRPRKLSPGEVEARRLLTLNYIERIHNLEVAKLHMSSSGNPAQDEVEYNLFWTTVNFRLILGTTFRIGDLPTEILTNIFHLVAWDGTDEGALIRNRNLLTSVSRHWRTVAIEDNTLWNMICFYPTRCKTACLWLERAGNATLDIRIQDSDAHPMSLALASEIIGEILKKISAVRVLIIIIRDWEPALLFLHRLQEVAANNTPMCLDRFEIHRTGLVLTQPGPGFLPELHKPVPLFGGALVPSLRCLVIDGIHIDWAHSSFSNLTVFDIRRQALEKSPSLRLFRQIISSPNLLNLVMITGGPQFESTESTFPLEPVRLAILRSLVLGGASLRYAIDLTHTFSAPNLREITFGVLFAGATDDEICCFFKGLESMPKIELLALSSTCPFPSRRQFDAFVSWLRSVPKLSYLRLYDPAQSHLNPFLYDTNGFDPPENENKSLVCPQLKVLELSTMSDINPILYLAKERKTLGAPLSKIYIEYDAWRKLKQEQPNVLEFLETFLVSPTTKPNAQEPEVPEPKVQPLRRGQRPRELIVIQNAP